MVLVFGSGPRQPTIVNKCISLDHLFDIESASKDQTELGFFYTTLVVCSIHNTYKVTVRI